MENQFKILIQTYQLQLEVNCHIFHPYFGVIVTCRNFLYYSIQGLNFPDCNLIDLLHKLRSKEIPIDVDS